MRYDPDLDDDEEEATTFGDEDPDPDFEDEPDPGPDLDDDEDEDTEDEVPEDDDAISDSDRAKAIEAQAETDSHPEGSRETRWVPLGDLVLEYRFWKNPRTFTGLDAESLNALSADIKAKTVNNERDQILAGIDEPLKVVRIAVNGGVVQLVLDGQRRHRAASMTGLGEDILIPVFDREPEAVPWSEQLARKYLKEALTTVGLRAQLSAFELSEAAEHLRGQKDLDTGKELTISQIASAIGRSDSWVSKILTARAAASPKLLSQWRNGTLTEEQFRDLATAVKDKGDQEKEAAKVVEQRKSGDKAGARQAAKEQKEVARQKAKAEREARKAAKAAKKAEKAKAKADKKAAKAAAKKQAKGKKGDPAVRGPQAELPVSAPPADPKPAPRPKAMSPAIVDDLLDQAKKKPPTHEFVKGVLAGIQVATGRLDLGDMPKPWHAYIHHLAGTKPERPTRKRK
jgi:hypothetical protein